MLWYARACLCVCCTVLRLSLLVFVCLFVCLCVCVPHSLLPLPPALLPPELRTMIAACLLPAC